MNNNQPRPAGAFRICEECGKHKEVSQMISNAVKGHFDSFEGDVWICRECVAAYPWNVANEVKCECPRCGRYCLAIIEDGSTSHDCEHCDKSFNLNVEG